MFVKANESVIGKDRLGLWVPAEKPEDEIFVAGANVVEVPDNDPQVRLAIAQQRLIEVDAPAAKPSKGNKPTAEAKGSKPASDAKGDAKPEGGAGEGDEGDKGTEGGAT